MSFTSSFIYVAAIGGLLYFACSKGYNTGSAHVPAPVVESPDRPSLSSLHEKGIADAMIDPNYVPVDVRDIPASYVPIDHNKLNQYN